jgi:putative hydrolase of the HAD superfamily
MKMERTGLAENVAGSAISGELGIKKPDARIFAAARDIAGGDGVAWMVGDNVEADIAGARAAGFATAWVSHGRPWPEPWMPTLTAGDTAALLASVASAIQDDAVGLRDGR